MHGCVTGSAKRDEVGLRIIAGLATEFLVVYLEIRHRPTALASPAGSPQDLLPQRLIYRGTELQSSPLRQAAAHDAISASRYDTCWFWGVHGVLLKLQLSSLSRFL